MTKKTVRVAPDVRRDSLEWQWYAAAALAGLLADSNGGGGSRSTADACAAYADALWLSARGF